MLSKKIEQNFFKNNDTYFFGNLQNIQILVFS